MLRHYPSLLIYTFCLAACMSRGQKLRENVSSKTSVETGPKAPGQQGSPSSPQTSGTTDPNTYVPPTSAIGAPPAADAVDPEGNPPASASLLFDPWQSPDQGYTNVTHRDFPVDDNLEKQRLASAQQVTTPVITNVLINNKSIWSQGQSSAAKAKAGDILVIRGTGFGAGVDIDYAKVLIGNTRMLERELAMYQGKVDLLRQLYYEQPSIVDKWPAAILSWSPTEIRVKIPANAGSGPLQIAIQKRTGHNMSLINPNIPHGVTDPLLERISQSGIYHGSDAVSVLSPAVTSNAVMMSIDNSDLASLISLGEKIYWSYDFNIGVTHWLRGLDWSAILAGKVLDPIAGKPADPVKLLGAIPLNAGSVPKAVSGKITFEPYPNPTPIKPLLRAPLLTGTTSPTGYVGYVHAEGRSVYSITTNEYTGFSCAACHARLVIYEDRPGHTTSKVFPGLPNPNWSMKWNMLGDMRGRKGFEWGPDNKIAYVDKTQLIYAVPNGVGEQTIVRYARDGSKYGNDHLFSPVAFPPITKHTVMRRSLSHTEFFAGFEGTYIHPQEPLGGVGAMTSASLRALTAYMATLDADNELLNNIGLYRWLKKNQLLAEANQVGEGKFVQDGRTAYPKVMARIARGREAFKKDCESCHQYNYGTWSDENMLPLNQVGSYFSPSTYQLEMQSIRTAILKNLWWVKDRGLLHDGHIRSDRALEDLIDPERCQEGSALYNRYYTINANTFKVPAGDRYQERAVANQAYFTKIAGDNKFYYWDYQSMRKSFGPRELGSAKAVPLPATPHPWCLSRADDVADVVAFLLTL